MATAKQQLIQTPLFSLVPCERRRPPIEAHLPRPREIQVRMASPPKWVAYEAVSRMQNVDWKDAARQRDNRFVVPRSF